MTELDMVLKAAKLTEERLREFAYGPEIFPDDFRPVVHDVGAFNVFVAALEEIRANEMP